MNYIKLNRLLEHIKTHAFTSLLEKGGLWVSQKFQMRNLIQELGPLRGWLSSRPLCFGGGRHTVSGWSLGRIPAMRRRSTLRWGNGGVLSGWRSGASGGGLCWSRHRRGWGCWKTSPSLCHGRNAWKWPDQIPKRWGWRAGLASLWLLHFKGLNNKGLGVVWCLKMPTATEKLFLDVRQSPGGKKWV